MHKWGHIIYLAPFFVFLCDKEASYLKIKDPNQIRVISWIMSDFHTRVLLLG